MALRRQFILEAGESLLVTNDPMRCLANHVGAAHAISIRQSDLVASRMSPMPMPIRGGRPDSGARRFPGIDPKMMWLPVLWLPARLRERCRFQFFDGDIVVIDEHGFFAGDTRAVATPIPGIEVNTESTDVWAIRVALELEACGAYDVDSGTWLDVLDAVGINVDEIEDVQRVESWLAGNPDEDLDRLQDIFMEQDSRDLYQEEPAWALSSALATYRDLLDATWALSSNSMLDAISQVTRGVEDGGITEASEAKFIANMLCMLAGPLLRWYSDDELEWWQEMSQSIERFSGSSHDLIAGPLAEIDNRLAAVRDDTWPRMQSATAKYDE